MSDPNPKTTPSDGDHAGEKDVQSDPAKGAGEQHADWSDEGGATAQGAATGGQD